MSWKAGAWVVGAWLAGSWQGLEPPAVVDEPTGGIVNESGQTAVDSKTTAVQPTVVPGRRVNGQKNNDVDWKNVASDIESVASTDQSATAVAESHTDVAAKVVGLVPVTAVKSALADTTAVRELYPTVLDNQQDSTVLLQKRQKEEEAILMILLEAA